jgi:hypothetical protein
MNEFIVRVRTDKDLGSEALVRGLLEEWTQVLDPRLRPEYYDFGEPVRRPLVGGGLEQAIDAWLEGGPAIMLARRMKPRFLADIKWRREKGGDRRPFPWGITIYLAFSAGDERADVMLRFLIRHLDPAFGYITTRDEEREKHQISFQDRIGLVQQYKGLDVGATLPGVYWKTFFGSAVTPRLSSFDRLPAHGVEEIAGGRLVTAYSAARMSGTREAREAEARIADWLGAKQFFDRGNVDLESLKSDDRTVEMIQSALRAQKANSSKRRG